MSTPARKSVLYVYCHPVPDSFHGAIREAALEGLARARHRIDLLDLYAEGFEPALSADERRRYYDTEANRQGLEQVIARLEAAEILVLQFPTWCFGAPAMLKGFVDRAMLPGVAFDIADGKTVRPLLDRIERIIGVVTYGQSRLVTLLASDHPRRLVTRHLRWIAAPKARTDYLALYDMDRSTAARRQAFLTRVGERMARLG